MRISKSDTPSTFLKSVKELYTVSDDDCFGKEFDRQDNMCSMCGMRNVCMVFSAKNLDVFAENNFKDLAPFVDTIDWDSIPYDKLLTAIETDNYSLHDLREVFRHYSNCKDDVAINTRVNKFIMTNNLKIVEGWVVK